MATYKFGSVIEASLVEMASAVVRLVDTGQPAVPSDVERVVRRVDQDLRHVLPPDHILSTERHTQEIKGQKEKSSQSHFECAQRIGARYRGGPHVAGCAT